MDSTKTPTGPIAPTKRKSPETTQDVPRQKKQKTVLDLTKDNEVVDLTEDETYVATAKQVRAIERAINKTDIDLVADIPYKAEYDENFILLPLEDDGLSQVHGEAVDDTAYLDYIADDLDKLLPKFAKIIHMDQETLYDSRITFNMKQEDETDRICISNFVVHIDPRHCE